MGTENKSVKFALVKINTDQFAIIESAFKMGSDVDLKIGLQFGANKVDKVISVKTSIQFEQQEVPFMMIQASCFFRIEPTDWATFVQGDEIVVPKSVITHFCVLTVGTVRGILHSKTEGTNYNGFVVPTINVTELVTDDIRI
jgi:hypothetical protein